MSAEDYKANLYAMSRAGRSIIDLETSMWAHARIAELSAIVDKLPKTADGVAVYPNMELFAALPDEGVFDGKVEYACKDYVLLNWSDEAGYDDVGLGLCYSTKSAAEAALEQAGQGATNGS